MTKNNFRQPVKWHGGKSYLSKWILGNFPPRESYTHYLEPFAGGLSVLFAHDPEGKSESVNDRNSQLANLWHVLRTPELFDQFALQVSLCEFSDNQFVYAKACCIDEGMQEEMTPAQRACAFFCRYRMSRQGLGKDYATPTRRTRRGMNENVSAYLAAVDGLPDVFERMRRVEVRNMLASDFIAKYDHSNAMFYLDPPYLHETRVTKSDYECEMSREEHRELLAILSRIKGKFMLSGYPSDLYEDHAMELGWRCVKQQIDNKASGKKSKDKKTECLWMNY